VYSLPKFYSATEISYETPHDYTSGRLLRTDLITQATQTFATAQTGNIDAWDWSPDGKTLAYFAEGQLWLKVGNQAAASIASYKSQPGRGGGWADEIAIRFSPSGKYFVAVHTVTIPLTFEIRRASDGGLVWSSSSANFGAAGFATMGIWSRQVDQLLFRDGTSVREWHPSGTITTLVPGLKWISPSISPDGQKVAYTVLDPTTFHLRVELLDLQTLRVRLLSSDRWNAMFASNDLLLYGRAGVQIPDRGTLAYDLNTGVETKLPFDILLDVWPAKAE
jgi:Tol biopolymer transport system component